jgi:ElaB/YqjD/DUF883 family membrane-anchored ribosome-binding protein
MAPEADVIRKRIEETRAALQAKLAALENQVRGTVGDVAARVQTTRAAVEQTALSMRRSLDLNYQMQERPWALLGGSFVLGTIVGLALSSRRQPSSRISRGGVAMRGDEDAARSVEALASAGGVSLFHRLAEPFQPELAKVRGLAVGFLMGAVRDVLKDSIPPNLAPHVEDILNNITTKMGGTLMPEPVLPSLHPQQDSSSAGSFGSRQTAGSVS